MAAAFSNKLAGGLFEQVLEGLGRSRIIRRQDY